MILLSVVKESIVFTHTFNFDGRKDATGAITNMQTSTSLIELVMEIEFTLKNCITSGRGF
jgi:hypothetical protein